MNKGRLLAKAVMAKQSKHPIAQQMGEEIKDEADVGEYDYEGDMAKSQLRSILAHAKRLHDMLEDQTNLPEWVQSKITLAQDYILTAADYMEGEMNEEVEQTDEALRLNLDGKRGNPAFKSKPEVAAHRKQTADVAKKLRGALASKSASALHGVEYAGKKLTVTGSKQFEEVEQVTEAEGTLAVTPKQKELAAHHGDKSRITYGDVLKARLKSAAEKAMKKGN